MDFDFDYNRILLENRQMTNKFALLWMDIMAGLVMILWMFSCLDIWTAPTWFFHISAPISVCLLLLPSLLHVCFHLSDIRKVGQKGVSLLTAFILGCSLLAISLLSTALSHYVAFAWMLPLLIACQYYSKKLTLITFFSGLIGMIISGYTALFVGVWDYNMMASPTLNGTRELTYAILGQATISFIPQVLLYCCSFPLFYAITKRTHLMMKKQRLSIMASQAKETLNGLQEFPDTFETDCKIKMRYLAKNGIDVDTALKNMEGNVEKYNNFILTFVGESNRKEDELYSLMEADTLLQYASKVHALRIKANALGLKSLTDTAFFHEMEAYAGNLEIVQLNWQKLSFEWDEACDTFTAYIQSLGLKNHASDKHGHQITFQQWGEQLNEAFQALEMYDTVRARNILNELLQYQIDTDITKNLELIVANIDDILKA